MLAGRVDTPPRGWPSCTAAATGPDIADFQNGIAGVGENEIGAQGLAGFDLAKIGDVVVVRQVNHQRVDRQRL